MMLHLAFLAAFFLAQAGDPNPLAGVPSRPGPHLEKIQALGDNQWLHLGKPEPDPRWGTARGRSWTPKMAYAPALKGAFFQGEGVHGFVKPDGHVMNDLWFYDAMAHRWICCYPGTKKEGMKLTLNADGFEVDGSGMPVPLAMLGHGYCNMTYLPDLGKYMVVHVNSQYWTSYAPQRKEWLAGGDRSPEAHPWLFDVKSGRFERRKATGSAPTTKYQGVLEYIPSLKEAFYQYQGKALFYDPAKNAWRDSGAKTDIPYDTNGCYDSKRNRVYVAKGPKLWFYDLAANRWETVQAEGQPDLPSCLYGSVYYDATADALVFHHNVSDKRSILGTIYAYHPERNAWDQPAKTFPEGVKTASMQLHGFYHAELNVHFLYLAGDSDDRNVTMLAYRYKRAARNK